MAKRLSRARCSPAVLPATALAATVHVRVEGKTQTLFAPTGSQLSPRQRARRARAGVDSPASSTTTSRRSSFGNVRRPGRTLRRHRRRAAGCSRSNNVSPPVGADQVQLKDGDHVLWYYATFGPTGGPPTLEREGGGQGLLHGDRVRRQRQGRRRSPGSSWHVGSKKTVAGSTGTPFCPGHAHRPARARDGDRRRPLERREVRVARSSSRSRSPSPVAAGAGASTGRRRCG